MSHKTQWKWREERAAKNQVGYNLSADAQTVSVGQCARFLKQYFKIMRNMDGNLEFFDRPITEEDRHEIHCALSDEFGNVTRYTVEAILKNAQNASHIAYDPFPERGFVKGIRHDLLYVCHNIGLHKCSDDVYRIRSYKNDFVCTTEVMGDIMDALEKYNSIIKLFGYRETVSYYNLNF